MQFFAIFLASIFPFLAQFLTASVARVAVALGFGTVTYAGVGFIFDEIISKLNASANFVFPHIATFIHLLGIDTALNIAMSSAVALMVLKGVSKSGYSRQLVWRKPGDKSPVDWSA
ncbi:minor head protein [Shewanella phage Dolos]|nr:minor head protein [Shewanella phage Dolos]